MPLALTRALLASLSADEIAPTIVRHVEERTAAEFGRTTQVVAALPPGVRAVYVSWLVDEAVNAGGFARLFATDASGLAAEASDAYAFLGAERYAAILRAAIATRELDGDRADYSDVDQRYYALGDALYAAWACGVRDRMEDFLG